MNQEPLGLDNTLIENKLKTKIRRSPLLKVVVIVVAVISIGSCVALWNRFYTPTCDLDQEIQSRLWAPSEIPNVHTLIDFMPSYCDINPSFFTHSPMRTITIKFGWNRHFCLGKVAIETMFINDGYGCGDIGNLIIIGPSLQVYYKNDNH